MPKQRDVMKKLWDAGNYRAALKMAAGWHRLGEHKEDITRGWAAAWNPSFYRQMKKDPEALYHRGLQAMAERYDLELDLKNVQPWTYVKKETPTV